MKYILICILLGSYGGQGRAAMSVEFDDIAACNAAANLITRTLEKHNGVVVMTCVPKGASK